VGSGARGKHQVSLFVYVDASPPQNDPFVYLY